MPSRISHLEKLSTITLSLLLLCAPSVAQSRFQVLHTFVSSSHGDGIGPWGHLTSDHLGNLYGTTVGGGTSNYGTVYELSPPSTIGGAWTETLLYSFPGSSTNQQGPQGNLVFDTAGNLFGTTFWGGSNNNGTIFELSPATGSAWTEKTLFRFSGTNGANPGGLYRAHSGVLYGTTLWGENAYQLRPPTTAGGNWVEKVLFTFNGTTDGEEPLYEGDALIADKAGNLYGTTIFGGIFGCGTAFELSPPASGTGSWTETVIHDFDCDTNDFGTTGALVMDSAGNLYGAASGGAYILGDIFELSPPTIPGQPWTEKILYSFQGGSDGSAPYAGLVMDKAGNLYGTTYTGGKGPCSFNRPGCGTVFEVSPQSDGTWTERVLHQFKGSDGQFPYAGLMIDGSGRLFGVTSEGGGTNAFGTAFEILP
jgi:uncharacterized repeat protein (TIGR03803 family)